MQQLTESGSTLEYFENLSNNSKEFLETVVSFSNTSGGIIYLGISKDFLEVVGLDTDRYKLEKEVVKLVENAVAPRVNFGTYVKTIDNQEVLAVNIVQGKETPYYIKDTPIEQGCFIRLGKHNRLATPIQVYEMQRRNAHIKYTELPDYEKNSRRVLEKRELDSLIGLLNMKSLGKKNISIPKLIDYNVIIEENETYYATIGYNLLADNNYSNAIIRICNFKGKDKSSLENIEEVEGTLLYQYYETLEYLKTQLYIGYESCGEQIEKFRISEEVLKELLVNAIIHRNYEDEGTIRISIFSDRLEFFSPGTLYDGMLYSDVMKGHSKLRNPNIAEVFYHHGIIEKYGTGIAIANAKLKENNQGPLIYDTESAMGVTAIVYFDKQKDVNSDILSNQFLKDYTQFRRIDVEKTLALSESQSRTLIEQWKDQNLIKQVGKARATKYIVKD